MCFNFGKRRECVGFTELLEKNNNLKQVDIVDRNEDQLKYARKMIRNTLAGILFDEAEAEKVVKEFGNREHDFQVFHRYGELKGDTNFQFYLGDIYNHIKQLKNPGKYYINLSNIPFSSHQADKDSSALFEYIRKSPVFKDGTVIHFSYGLRYDIMVEKRGGELVQIDLKNVKAEKNYNRLSLGRIQWPAPDFDSGFRFERRGETYALIPDSAYEPAKRGTASR